MPLYSRNEPQPTHCLVFEQGWRTAAGGPRVLSAGGTVTVAHAPDGDTERANPEMHTPDSEHSLFSSEGRGHGAASPANNMTCCFHPLAATEESAIMKRAQVAFPREK